MNNITSRVELPVGECKTTEFTKSFSKGSGRVCISCKSEERRLGQTVIEEQEKTRVSSDEKAMSVLRVNTVKEDGIKKKIIEYALLEKQGDEIKVRRRKKVIKNKCVLQNWEISRMEKISCYYGLRDELIKNHGICRIKK